MSPSKKLHRLMPRFLRRDQTHSPVHETDEIQETDEATGAVEADNDTQVRNDLNSQTVFRLQGIPAYATKETIKVVLSTAYDVRPEITVHVVSLADDLTRDERVATLSFSDVPRRLAQTKHGVREFPDLPVPSTIGEEGASSPVLLSLDIHFYGMTPLYTPKHWSVDIVAIPGLNGHAFGSFKARGGSFMWLRDDLPRAFPNARIWIYGYDSQLLDSRSYQSLEDLGLRFCNSLRSIRPKIRGRIAPKSLVLIGHSLGGLVLKQALCQLSETEHESDKSLLRSVRGILFFGVPNQGMAVESVLPMVKAQPNENFLRSLGPDEPLSRQLAHHFSRIMDSPELKIISFYEIVASPTIKKVNGKWSISGTPARLVGILSATHGRSWETGQKFVYPINRDHSALVKFTGPYDTDYKEGVLPRLLEMSETARSKPVLSTTEKECLQSLSFPEQNFRPDQIHTAEHNTCTWLLSHPTYTKWIEKPSGLLWIQGSPGVGKSTVMKFAAQHLERELRMAQDETILLCYFFHGRETDLQKTHLGLFRSLLNQLLPNLPDVLSELTSVYQDRCTRLGFCGKAWKWGSDELQQQLKRCLLETTRSRPIIILVDALDECGARSARDLMKLFSILLPGVPGPSTRLKLCFSCRYYPNLRSSAVDNQDDTIAVEDNNSLDIAMVAKTQLSDMSLPKREVLQHDIIVRSQGVFQWVVLVCAKVLELDAAGDSLRSLQSRIREVPEDLDDLYASLLGELNATNRVQTVQLFQWICFAKRPMRVFEIQYALVINPYVQETSIERYEESEYFRHDYDDVVRAVKNLSKGLAECKISHVFKDRLENVKQGVVQLIHQTVLDYLLGGWLQPHGLPRFPTPSGFGHFGISRSCICYLLLLKIDKSLEEPHDYLNLGGFYHEVKLYAMQYLEYHLKAVNAAGDDQLDLLGMLSWPQDDTILDEYGGEIFGLEEFRLSSGPWLLHWISREGLSRLLRWLLVDGQEVLDITRGRDWKSRNKEVYDENFEESGLLKVNVRDKSMRTPLHYAASRGRKEVVDLLLGTGRVNPNLQDRRLQTPIFSAVDEGQSKTVSRLLSVDAVDPNIVDRFKWTPLHQAAHDGNTKAVSRLLSCPRTLPDLQDDQGCTPLHIAAREGHNNIVRELTKRDDVDINHQDRNGQTVLHAAINGTHVKPVRQLLACSGINPNLPNSDSLQPVFSAVREIKVAQKPYSMSQLVQIITVLLDPRVDPCPNDSRFEKIRARAEPVECIAYLSGLSPVTEFDKYMEYNSDYLDWQPEWCGYEESSDDEELTDDEIFLIIEDFSLDEESTNNDE